jgi:tetratricopeptide (TPR) repeat protein
MGFRARRSIKIAPGVRMNISAKSIGVSAGVSGARISANSTGRVTKTVGIPGTGISHVSSSTAKGRTPVKAPPPPKAAKPGLRAPAWEKALFKQITGTVNGPALHALANENPEANQTIHFVEVLYVAMPADDRRRVRALMNWLFDVGYEPASDPFVEKYIPGRSLGFPIAEGISVSMPVSRSSLGLALAEMEQDEGDRDRAIQIVEALEPTTIAAVSLAELYSESERWADVVDLTNGLTNEDDASTYLLIQRGRALREQGYPDASRESLKEALRVRSRPAELRNLALIERGKTYLSENKKAMARKDFEKVMADNADYPGLADLIGSLD